MSRFLLSNRTIGIVNSDSKLIERQYQISLKECVKKVYLRNNDITFQIHKIEKYENGENQVAQKSIFIGNVVYDYNNGFIYFNAVNDDFDIVTISSFKTKKFSNHYIKCEMEMYENERFKKYIENIFNIDDELLFKLTDENYSIINTNINKTVVRKILDIQT